MFQWYKKETYSPGMQYVLVLDDLYVYIDKDRER